MVGCMLPQATITCNKKTLCKKALSYIVCGSAFIPVCKETIKRLYTKYMTVFQFLS